MDQEEVKLATQLEIVAQLSERQRQRLEVIQNLIAAPDQATYRQRQQAATERLNLSISSLSTGQKL